MNLLRADISVLAVVVAVYVNYPAPPLSDRLRSWMVKGTFHTHNGHKIFYRDDEGSSSNSDVLVCLHGFPTSSYDWVLIWDKLTTQYSRVIAVDFIGFGFSDKPRGHSYTFFEQADIVEALLDHLQLESVHLLAHDYGDTVAQELLARYESRITAAEPPARFPKLLSVILTNGGVFPETNHPRLTQKALLVPFVGSVLARLMNKYTFRVGFGDVFGSLKPTSTEYDNFWGAISYNQGQLVMPALLDYINQRRINRDRWVRCLQKTAVPLLMIYGPSDPVNPPAFIQHFRELVLRGQLVELGADVGHYPQWEDPHALTDALTTFTNSLRSKDDATQT